MSDIQIIEQLKNRNKQAINCILEKYGNALYGIIYREVKTELLAKKVMNLLCLEIWQNVQEYDKNKTQFFTWLVKTVYQLLNKNSNETKNSFVFLRKLPKAYQDIVIYSSRKRNGTGLIPIPKY